MLNHNVYWSNMWKLKGNYNDCTTLQAKPNLKIQKITVRCITIGIDRPWNDKLLSFLTKPLSLGYLWTTQARGQRFRSRLSPFTMTTSSIAMFLLVLTHFCLVCNNWRESVFRLFQNSFARYCTWHHLFLLIGRHQVEVAQHWISLSVTDMVQVELDHLHCSGHQLWVDDNLQSLSASAKKVHKDSSSSRDPWWLNRAVRMLCTFQIWGSHTPPIWLAWGMFNL